MDSHGKGEVWDGAAGSRPTPNHSAEHTALDHTGTIGMYTDFGTDIQLYLSAAIDPDAGEVARLLDAGADVNSLTGHECPIFGPERLQTALIGAVRGGHVEIAGLLLKNKANPNIAETGCSDGCPEDGGLTPLMLAAIDVGSNGGFVAAELITLLAQYGAIMDTVHPWGGGTALILCCTLQPNVDVVSALVKHGCDLAAKDTTGHTAAEIIVQDKYQLAVDVKETLANLLYTDPPIMQYGCAVSAFHPGSRSHNTLLFEGCTVRLHDLQSKVGQKLNGKDGVAGSYVTAAGRWTVTIDGHSARFKPENLQYIDGGEGDRGDIEWVLIEPGNPSFSAHFEQAGPIAGRVVGPLTRGCGAAIAICYGGKPFDAAKTMSQLLAMGGSKEWAAGLPDMMQRLSSSQFGHRNPPNSPQGLKETSTFVHM